MEGFVAVLLREGLRFSPEHVEEINMNMQNNMQDGLRYQADSHDVFLLQLVRPNREKVSGHFDFQLVVIPSSWMGDYTMPISCGIS